MTNYCKHIVRYYNVMSGDSAETISEIPFESLKAVLSLSHHDRVKALLSLEINGGSEASERRLARNYNVDRQVVRTIKKSLV